ncbi:protein serine/threonine phosphatase 2C [Trametes maxima]|nr:protein serine/threonine phosphatase 2C [Trametes maxima]
MLEPRLDAARQRLTEAFHCSKTGPQGVVHTVTFQPLGPGANDDRLVVESWTSHGDKWLCLAVCDGHNGNTTSEYTARMLPERVRIKLENYIEKHLSGPWGSNDIPRIGAKIASYLKHQICRFDVALGEAVRRICPNPWTLSETQSRQLVREHEETLVRAFEGTTLSMALVNIDRRLMWGIGVGDSTIALRTRGPQAISNAERLCETHNFKNPREFYRVIMSRTSAEKNIVDRDNRVLGWLAPSRAIGDFMLKMHSSYLRHMFRYLPSKQAYPLDELVDRVVTPPYVTAYPDVRFVDLGPIWAHDPVILLYTDGVDHLIDGHLVFTPNVHSGADPLAVTSALLGSSNGETVDIDLEAALGHPIEPRWSRTEGNTAADILGNLLGGANPERLEMAMDRERLTTDDPDSFIQIDDTTIIVAPLTRM